MLLKHLSKISRLIHYYLVFISPFALTKYVRIPKKRLKRLKLNEFSGKKDTFLRYHGIGYLSVRYF